MTGWADVNKRIGEYLASGGLFNPELAIHDHVRDLLIDCRAAMLAAHDDGMEAAAVIADAMECEWANLRQDGIEGYAPGVVQSPSEAIRAAKEAT